MRLELVEFLVRALKARVVPLGDSNRCVSPDPLEMVPELVGSVREFEIVAVVQIFVLVVVLEDLRPAPDLVELVLDENVLVHHRDVSG